MPKHGCPLSPAASHCTSADSSSMSWHWAINVWKKSLDFFYFFFLHFLFYFNFQKSTPLQTSRFIARAQWWFLRSIRHDHFLSFVYITVVVHMCGQPCHAQAHLFQPCNEGEWHSCTQSSQKNLHFKSNPGLGMAQFGTSECSLETKCFVCVRIVRSVLYE